MNTALVVVDIQRALVDALAPERRREFLTVIERILTRARAANMPVVYIRHNDDELVWGTPGWDIAAEIGPQPGEAIVEKRFRDAFRQTYLADVLAELGADVLIVCGMQTEYCVDATIREAERRGYRVTLVEDGHATFPDVGLSEEQIRALINRVARDTVASIRSADEIFTPARHFA
jgi:nicotinamidase-related amidase